jgi:hypothetical protein
MKPVSPAQVRAMGKEGIQVSPSAWKSTLWIGRSVLALLFVVVMVFFAQIVWQETQNPLEAASMLIMQLLPVAMLFLGLTLLLEVVEEEAVDGAMRPRVRRLLYWTPRVIMILFAIFVSVFALDVFDAGYGFWGTLFALLMHLIPTALILLALAIAWRWEWVGGLLFVGLGLLYTVMAGEFWWWSLLIAGPLFVVGALFLANWRYRRELHLRV